MSLNYTIPFSEKLPNIDAIKNQIGQILAHTSRNSLNYNWDGNELTCQIKKLGGKSTIVMHLSENKDGTVQFIEDERDIAWAHKAFIGLAESHIHENLVKIGSKKIS